MNRRALSSIISKRGKSACLRSLHIFDKDIACTKEARSGYPDRHAFRAHVSDAWSVGDAPNGGYLACMMLNAALQVSPFRDPLSLSTHFISKSIENAEAIVDVQILNLARTQATLQIAIIQGGRHRCVMIGTFGSIKSDGLSVPSESARAPDVPPVDQCRSVADELLMLGQPAVRIAKQLKFYTPTDAVIYRPTNEISRPVVEGRLSFYESRPHDFFSSLFLLDSLPPPVMNVVAAPWFPTLEYTVHFWADSTDYFRNQGHTQALEPLVCRFESNHIENGTFHTDGELWSPDGVKLLAKSRQLARIVHGKN